jgi:GNAT superfamily N-acetyltransferase
MEIRVASPADAGAIADVHVEAIRAAYRDLFPADALAAIDLGERSERWRQRLIAGGSVTLVGESAGSLLGFAEFGPSRDEESGPGGAGEVMAIYVRPAVWGTGVGRDLLRAALDQLSGCGFRRATLWALEGNERAARFYAAAGFARDGARSERAFLGFTVPVVRYARPLHPPDLDPPIVVKGVLNSEDIKCTVSTGTVVDAPWERRTRTAICEQ